MNFSIGFPPDMREEKLREFINLKQVYMSVKEYSLKCLKLCKYDSSFVTNPRDEMIHFVKGVSDDLKEECHSSMLHEKINISHFIMHSQNVKRKGLRKSVEILRGQYLFMVVLQRIGLNTRKA